MIYIPASGDKEIDYLFLDIYPHARNQTNPQSDYGQVKQSAGPDRLKLRGADDPEVAELEQLGRG